MNFFCVSRYITRIAAIVNTVVLIALCAATIKIIQDNNTLARVAESDDYASFLDFTEYDTYKDFQEFIHETQVMSRWVIGVCSVIFIVVIVDLVLTVITDIRKIKFRLQITIRFIELFFIILGMLGFIGICFVFGSLAGAWSPLLLNDICDSEKFKIVVVDDSNADDPCDSVALTTTLSLASGFSFFQLGVFFLELSKLCHLL